jgi:hypothetical protein
MMSKLGVLSSRGKGGVGSRGAIPEGNQLIKQREHRIKIINKVDREIEVLCQMDPDNQI